MTLGQVQSSVEDIPAVTDSRAQLSPMACSRLAQHYALERLPRWQRRPEIVVRGKHFVAKDAAVTELCAYCKSPCSSAYYDTFSMP